MSEAAKELDTIIAEGCPGYASHRGISAEARTFKFAKYQKEAQHLIRIIIPTIIIHNNAQKFVIYRSGEVDYYDFSDVDGDVIFLACLLIKNVVHCLGSRFKRFKTIFTYLILIFDVAIGSGW